VAAAGAVPVPLAGSVSAAEAPDCPPALVVPDVVVRAASEVVTTDCDDTTCSFWVRVESPGSFASNLVTSDPESSGEPSVTDSTVMPEDGMPASP
jgi:hypothetical protein